MLQQTTVAAVKPYYARFLALWPTVEALAGAPREHIMKEWAGLGYYARARNLHDCARTVVERHGGCFPASEGDLRHLPGIGDYTAAAIAAIAFGAPAAVVDGNVERVMARLFAVNAPLPSAKPEIRRLTAALVPPARPGDFAQATMDFGAVLCTPKSPACGICPIRSHCRAQAEGAPTDYPRRRPKTVRPQRYGAVAVLERPDGAILVRTRPSTGLLGGMSEFYGTPWTEGPADPASLRIHADGDLIQCGVVDHTFTHFALRLDVFSGLSGAKAAPPGCRWVDHNELTDEPFPSLMLKVLRMARP